MNRIYEILANAANLDRIEYGQEIQVNIDLALAHDGSMPKIINEVENLPPSQKIHHSNKLRVTIDHFLPAPNIKSRENYYKIKEFCERYNIFLYSNGEGILHQVIAEEFGDRLKGKIVVGVDGHMCTSAGLGTVSFSITPSEMASVLTTGKYTLVVPKVIEVQLVGSFNYDNKDRIMVTGKDIGVFLIKKLGIGKLKGNALLLNGNAFCQLSESQKMTIGNILGEIGVKTVYFSKEYTIGNDRYCLNIDEIKPFVVLPGSVENVVDIKDIIETNITQVYIGGCTNGRLDDMEQVAEILLDKKIHPNVTLIVCPASRKVANDMDRLGYSEIIRNSGGIIINPGCGACSGIHQGTISKEDIIVTTTPRNTPGRMGDNNAQIYIASPKVAAIFSLKGKISNVL